MKVSSILVIFLLVCSFAVALDSGGSPTTDSSSGTVLQEGVGIGQDGVRNGLDAVRAGAESAGDAGTSSSIVLGDPLLPFIRLIFRLDSSSVVTLDYFILLLVLFIMVVVVAFELSSIFSDSPFVTWGISLCLGLFTALMGLLRNSSVILGDIVTLASDWMLVFWIVIGCIVVVVAIETLKKFRDESRVEEAGRLGVALGSMGRVAKGRMKWARTLR